MGQHHLMTDAVDSQQAQLLLYPGKLCTGGREGFEEAADMVA